MSIKTTIHRLCKIHIFIPGLLPCLQLPFGWKPKAYRPSLKFLWHSSIFGWYDTIMCDPIGTSNKSCSRHLCPHPSIFVLFPMWLRTLLVLHSPARQDLLQNQSQVAQKSCLVLNSSCGRISKANNIITGFQWIVLFQSILFPLIQAIF